MTRGKLTRKRTEKKRRGKDRPERKARRETKRAPERDIPDAVAVPAVVVARPVPETGF